MELFFALNNFNMVLDFFFGCFWEFYFLSESDDFAKAIAFAWWPVILEMLSSFEY